MIFLLGRWMPAPKGRRGAAAGLAGRRMSLGHASPDFGAV